MPEGEHSWKRWKGPRRKVTCALPAWAYRVYEIAGADLGTSATGHATDVLVRYAEGLLQRAESGNHAGAAEADR